METYFNIRYEFDKEAIHSAIDARLKQPGSDYICVADGVILDHVNRNEDYRKVVDGGMFSICDSGFVPLYLKMLYKIQREQYTGSDIFHHIVSEGKYRMCFLGASQKILDALRKQLTKMNPDVEDMLFYELPFCELEEFDYEAIADMIESDGAEVIWVALGAPKQEMFMARLKPCLDHGVMIAVGAAFKFYSGVDSKRAPKWMIAAHLEFLYRIFSEPRKQTKRCIFIIIHLPRALRDEYRRKVEKERMMRSAA